MTLYGTRLQYTYTTEEEMVRLFGHLGSESFIDDISASDSEYWTELIESVTGTINQYLAGVYDPVDLAQSPWVRRRATYLAAHEHSIRKGNPGIYNTNKDEILAELIDAKEGNIFIGVAMSAGIRPVMQNVMHDNRFLYNSIRVLNVSSNRNFSGQNDSYIRPFWWW